MYQDTPLTKVTYNYLAQCKDKNDEELNTVYENYAKEINDLNDGEPLCKNIFFALFHDFAVYDQKK